MDGAVAAEGREEGVETKTLLRFNLYDLETFRGEGEREVIRTALRSLVWVDRWLDPILWGGVGEEEVLGLGPIECENPLSSRKLGIWMWGSEVKSALERLAVKSSR